MFKKYFLALLLMAGALPIDAPCWFYTKFGTELGVGYRSHGCRHGFDVSVNATTIFVDSWIDAKVLYLNYPFHNNFYWGVGAGVSHEVAVVLMGHYSGFHHTTSMTAETMLGCEFYLGRNRYFMQAEAGFPLTSRSTIPVIPAIVFGIAL